MVEAKATDRRCQSDNDDAMARANGVAYALVARDATPLAEHW